MACKKCASNKTTACACTDTSYTIPGNCGYGNSTCKFPSEPCSEILCTECIRHCHDEDKWCTEMLLTDWGGQDGVANGGDDMVVTEFCVSNGERLDQMFQKLTLALSDPTSYPYKVKNFYVNNINNVTGSYFIEIQFVWFDFLSTLTDIQLWYQADGDGDDWVQIQQFNTLINPLQSNSFTLNNDMVGLIPGNTYKFKLATTSDAGTFYDPGSVILFVTIPE